MTNLFDRSSLLRSLHPAATINAVLALAIGGGAAVVLPSATAWAAPVAVDPVVLPSFADLADKVGPAVVSVRVRIPPAQTVSQTTPPGGNGAAPIPPQGQRGGTALGSGFFISDDGFVVTNNHVVEGASTYTVITSDGTEYTAKLIGKDAKTDLAVLKVDSGPTFPYVKWADQTPRIGDWAVAIGNPFGLGGTVTMGIVSARGRQISAGLYDDYLQIDAPINRGNSGGPTFNTRGEVIGINTAIYSTTGGSVGIAFDIPSTDAAPVIDQLRKNGAIVRGWLGVQTQSLTTTIAESLRLADAKGAMVAEPQAGSPAEVAGIMAGDVILSVDGKPIADPRDLALVIAGDAPNSTVRVSVWRNGAAQDISVKLGTLPPDPAPATPTPRPPANGGNGGPGGGNGAPGSGNGGPGGGGPGANGGNSAGPAASGSGTPTTTRDGTTLADIGMTVAASTKKSGGVDVFDVTPDGIADRAGLSDGDVILAVAGTSVSTASDVQVAIATARQNGAKALLLRVQSGQNTQFLAIPLG